MYQVFIEGIAITIPTTKETAEAQKRSFIRRGIPEDKLEVKPVEEASA